VHQSCVRAELSAVNGHSLRFKYRATATEQLAYPASPDIQSRSGFDARLRGARLVAKACSFSVFPGRWRRRSCPGRRAFHDAQLITSANAGLCMQDETSTRLVLTGTTTSSASANLFSVASEAEHDEAIQTSFYGACESLGHLENPPGL